MPKKIKVGGQIYDVKYITGMIDSGNTDEKRNIILINDLMVESEKESTLLHEVIEVINSNYDLNLEHQTIQTLEACLYQVFKENKHLLVK